MSENEDPKPKTGPQAQPMTKTSAVPIRKETVRVTLKAPPQGGKGPTAPPAPLTPPTGAVPTSPKPAVPAPSAPLKSPGAPPAPTAPAGAVPPTPAPTVKLQTGAAAGPATKLATPAPTVPLNTPGAGGASQQLPKATVQLAQTQPMEGAHTPSQAATILTADDDDSSEGEEGLIPPLSIACAVAALIVLGLQLATASIWVEGEWGKLFE